MATIVIDFREALPRVCARCGEPATTKVERVFRYQEPSLTYFSFGLVGLMVRLLRPRPDHWLVVDVPFCDRHKNGWRVKEILGWSLFLVVLGIALGLSLIVGLVQGSRLGGTMLIGLIFGALGGAFATFWVSAVFEYFTVRLKVMDPTQVRLAGIADEFADQVVILRRDRANAPKRAGVPREAANADEDNPWKGFNTDPFEKLS